MTEMSERKESEGQTAARVHLSADERRRLRERISDAARNRVAAEKEVARRDEEHRERSFYVCAKIAYSVAGYDFRCSKRALPGSLYCPVHQDVSAGRG